MVPDMVVRLFGYFTKQFFTGGIRVSTDMSYRCIIIFHILGSEEYLS